MPSSLPCAPALQVYWSERDSCGPFLLQNINDFPLPSRAGNRHQLAEPTETAGCQPACPPAHKQPPLPITTTWEEETPQAGLLALPVWLSEQPGEPYPGLSPCCRQGETPSTGYYWQRGNGSLIKVTPGENLLHAAPVTTSPKFRPH